MCLVVAAFRRWAGCEHALRVPPVRQPGREPADASVRCRAPNCLLAVGVVVGGVAPFVTQETWVRDVPGEQFEPVAMLTRTRRVSTEGRNPPTKVKII